MADRQTKNAITSLQKKALRIVCGLKTNYHTAEFFNLTEILPIRLLHTLNVLKLLNYIKNTDLNHMFMRYWPYHFELGHRSSVRYLKTIITDKLTKEKFKRLPLFAFGIIFNEISKIFLTIDIPEIKSYLLITHTIANKCTKSPNKCYACKKHATDSVKVWQKRHDKAIRIKELIKAKGEEKTKRYQWLISKM